MAKETRYSAIGRRKSSVAKVTITPGKGVITVNGKDVNDYMPYETLVMDLVQPLELVDAREKYDVNVVVKGGGFSGQTGAIRLGITRALLVFDADSDQTREDSYRKILKAAGFITRDPRVKERKKYGLKKARRAPQFSKR
jgi:small subunit ribosomal protein S9